MAVDGSVEYMVPGDLLGKPGSEKFKKSVSSDLRIRSLKDRFKGHMLDSKSVRLG